MGAIQQQMGGTDNFNSPMVLEDINTEDGRNNQNILWTFINWSLETKINFSLKEVVTFS